MTTKEAICNQDELNGKYSCMASVEWRSTKDAYERFYTKEQLAYLFEHGLIEIYKKTGAVWESPYCEYYQFTEKGKKLRQWYGNSFWTYVKVYVLKWYSIRWFVRHYWQKLMIKFGKHYTWQEYEGVNLNEI